MGLFLGLELNDCIDSDWDTFQFSDTVWCNYFGSEFCVLSSLIIYVATTKLSSLKVKCSYLVHCHALEFYRNTQINSKHRIEDLMERLT